ncbi:MAG: signal peptidase II [Anaerolineales bacterium]|nr:signal peptidase II [Anaerolineales bacterium]
MLKRLVNQSLVFWIAGAVVLVDQYVKYLVRANLAVGETWSPAPGLDPYFRLLHIENTGAAFGMFQSGGTLFMIVAIIVSVVITYYATRLPEGQWALRTTLGLQLGGALGNLVDRLVNGPVTDFFNVLSVFNTPIFNVADLSITLGVIALVLLMWGEARAPKPHDTPTPASPPAPGPDAGPAA